MRSRRSSMPRIRDKKEREGRRAKKKKGIKAQRVKPPTLTWGIDALIRDEKQNIKLKKKNKKGASPQPSYPGPLFV